MANAYFADLGWVGANLPGLPNSQTLWTLASGRDLGPGSPVVLTYAAPSGLAFTRTIAVDARSMFTITDTVANQGSAPTAARAMKLVIAKAFPQPQQERPRPRRRHRRSGDRPFGSAAQQLRLMEKEG